MSETPRVAVAQLASQLRGDGGGLAIDESLALFHGVHALLVHAGTAAPGLRNATIAQVAWELRHRAVVAEVLAALGAAGIDPIVFKGTALAYSLYPEPALRTRGDTDLLVPEGRRADAERVFANLGFARSDSVSGELIAYQATWSRTHDGADHAFDVHWRFANSELLSRVFTHEELARDADDTPALSAHARIPCRVHALLIACLHRAIHDAVPYHVGGESQVGGDRLIWLYDVHLLARALDAAQWSAVGALARGKGLARVVRDGLQATCGAFGTTFPSDVLAALNDAARRHEPVSDYVRSGRARREWLDFRAIAGAGRKLRFLRELAFPPAGYMRSRFGSGWLPWLYLRRAAGGLRKRLQRA